MKSSKENKILKSNDNHRVDQATQTGFSSPATHYNELRIDLNSVLVPNTESTFFIRVIDNNSLDIGIAKNDVLIVDKSLTPTTNQLAVVILNNNFKIVKISNDFDQEILIWGVITYIIKSVL